MVENILRVWCGEDTPEPVAGRRQERTVGDRREKMNGGRQRNLDCKRRSGEKEREWKPNAQQRNREGKREETKKRDRRAEDIKITECFAYLTLPVKRAWPSTTISKPRPSCGLG